MKRLCASFWVVMSILTGCQIHAQATDSERLGMALEYFRTGKYHEALLLFERLDSQYLLNPRFHAYMGICCYKEWLYQEACTYLDQALPQLEIYAPHERSVYYYTAAECHFQLEQYDVAIPLYEKTLTVCYDNEKGDVYYRIALCYMFDEQWLEARDGFLSALSYYKRYRNTESLTSRIRQIENMQKGCEKHIKKEYVNLTPTVPEQEPSDGLDDIEKTQYFDTLHHFYEQVLDSEGTSSLSF